MGLGGNVIESAVVGGVVNVNNRLFNLRRGLMDHQKASMLEKSLIGKRSSECLRNDFVDGLRFQIADVCCDRDGNKRVSESNIFKN